MGVTSQITEHLLWASERTLRVDHPVLSEQWSQPGSKGFRLSEELQISVKFEFLTPAVQHAEEADLRAEMLGIARDFQKGFCTGAKQEVVDDPFVLQHQRSQVTRKRENHMDVTCRKKFPATLFQPTFPSTCLTFRAMPISA